MPWISYRIKPDGVRRQVISFSMQDGSNKCSRGFKNTTRRKIFREAGHESSFLMLFCQGLAKSSSSKAKNLTNEEVPVTWEERLGSKNIKRMEKLAAWQFLLTMSSYNFLTKSDICQVSPIHLPLLRFLAQ